MDNKQTVFVYVNVEKNRFDHQWIDTKFVDLAVKRKESIRMVSTSPECANFSIQRYSYNNEDSNKCSRLIGVEETLDANNTDLLEYIKEIFNGLEHVVRVA